MKTKNYSRDILKCEYDDSWANWPSDSNKGIEKPEVQKGFGEGGNLIDLTAPEDFSFDIKLQDAIASRRSHREYLKKPLNLKELSFLLWATQGITDAGRVYHRAVPSASARHPFETYLIIKNVETLKLGIYRYLPLNHKLCHVTETLKDIDNICLDTNVHQMSEASVIFVWAAIPYRTEWRFGPYAYKYVAMDAGHVCQNLYLAAGAIGAGVCAIAAYDQNAVDNAIKVNGKDEFAIYLATVGKIA